jgi:beta-glucuronidase
MKMCLAILVALFVITPFVQAQPAELITNTEGRKTTSLNGQWQMIVDPYESGYYNYRYQPSDNGYFRNAKPKSKSDLIEYDFDKSATLKVPGDWNTQSDQLFFYEGTVWYKKSLITSAGAIRGCSFISAGRITSPMFI